MDEESDGLLVAMSWETAAAIFLHGEDLVYAGIVSRMIQPCKGRKAGTDDGQSTLRLRSDFSLGVQICSTP